MTQSDFKKSQRGLKKGKELFQVHILGKEKLQSAIFHSRKEAYILISGGSYLKPKDLTDQIREILKEFPEPDVIPAHTLYLELPYLFVDDQLVSTKDFWKKLESLKKEEVKGIVRASKVPWCLYGENSKYGAIFITTQNK